MVDSSHRLVTANMIELRHMVRKYVREQRLATASAVLDFGCGTGLYAGLFLREGLRYHGFDVDTKFLSYAQMLHRNGRFHSNWHEVIESGPFALVVANCCFHHINDRDASSALGSISSVLAPDGVLLFIDHIPPTRPHVSRLRRAYRLLERGEHIRSAEDYMRLIRPRMQVRAQTTERSYVFSFRTRLNPLFNELVVLQCGLTRV